MIRLYIFNTNDQMLDLAVESAQQQADAVTIISSQTMKASVEKKYGAKVQWAKLYNPQFHSVFDLALKDQPTYFSIMTSQQVIYKDKFKKLQTLLDIEPIISYAYSDFSRNLNPVFEHPFELRVIGTGYRPNPFGLYKTSKCIGGNPAQMMDFLLQSTMFAHHPEVLHNEQQNDPYYK